MATSTAAAQLLSRSRCVLIRCAGSSRGAEAKEQTCPNLYTSDQLPLGFRPGPSCFVAWPQADYLWCRAGHARADPGPGPATKSTWEPPKTRGQMKTPKSRALIMKTPIKRTHNLWKQSHLAILIKGSLGPGCTRVWPQGWTSLLRRPFRRTS